MVGSAVVFAVSGFVPRVTFGACVDFGSLIHCQYAGIVVSSLLSAVIGIWFGIPLASMAVSVVVTTVFLVMLAGCCLQVSCFSCVSCCLS